MSGKRVYRDLTFKWYHRALEYTSRMHIRVILEILWLLIGISWAVRSGLRGDGQGFLFAFLFLVLGFFVLLQPS